MPDVKFAADYEFARTCLKNNDATPFIERFGAYIKNKIRSSLRNDDLVDDVCQNILMELFTTGSETKEGEQEKKPGLEKYEGMSSLKTWLFLVVHRRTIDFIRGLKDSESIGDMDLPDSSDLSNELIQNENQDFLHLGLKILREWDIEKTAIMEGHYFEGLTFSQLSRAFNKPLTTVFNYKMEAERKLKEIFIKRFDWGNRP